MTQLSWFWDQDGPNWSRVVLLGLTVTVIVALGVVGATSATAFAPYNPSWDGTSDLREEVDSDAGIESEFVSETSRYQEVDTERTVAFVIAPDDSYEDENVDHVRQFVENGGTLVVLENFGDSGDDLLRDIGASARLHGDILKDERHYHRAPTMPIATGVENHTRTAGIEQLTLNYGTAVQPGNATVLVQTSGYAYLVEDETEELEDDDELAAYPVATTEEVGSGEVIVVGDPSITINVMLAEPDNAAFLRGLYLEADRVLFDISHAQGIPPLTNVLLTVRGSPLLQFGLGGLGIAGLALLSGRRVRPRLIQALQGLPVWSKYQISSTDERHSPGMSDTERSQYLRNQHPDWDEKRIERIIRGLNKPDSKEDTTNE